LFYFGIFYLAVRSLNLHSTLGKSIDVLGIILLTILAVRFLSAIMEFIIAEYWLKKTKDEKKEKSIKALLPAIKVAIWCLAVVFLLDNLGFKISTVVAGLGIGGVAVALAAQAVLKDLFSYFAILFDRPFEVGDFIIIGDYLGTVEHIGIKTTRIRSLSGEQMVFSNTDLTDSRVRNYKRMEKRRVVFRLGVVYQTTLEQLKAIPDTIKNIITSIDDTAFDRAHFFSYGDFSLVCEIVYYVLSSDYNKYMDIQQRINLAIKEEFEKRGIEFAYPTQTLFLTKAE
jgi:small-conductance mechanosensitive channel